MSDYIFQCEGKLWKRKPFFNENKGNYTHTQYPTYWCRGGTCVERNNDIDFDLPLEAWTINEIINTFDTPINEDLIAIYAGWCNRRNELLERLDCRKCTKILKPEPIDIQRLGHYSVPLFKCMNSNCSEYEKTIRLTHCCNGNCNGYNQTLIDSRDCPQCSESLLVCQDCHACCKSHHDRKIACCNKCGNDLNNPTDRNDNLWICHKCNITIQDSNLELLKKFWDRSMDYQDKFRENI